MSQFNPKIISDFGQLLKQLNRPIPITSIYTNGFAGHGKTIHRIGTRYLYSCFLLQRDGLYTVYANPRYNSYRSAYKQALSIDISEADVDHYFARAAAEKDMKLDAALREEDSPAASPDGEIFLAMGALPRSINRSVQDKTDLITMMMKLLGQSSLDPKVKTAIGMRKYDDPAIAEKVLSTGFQAPHALVRWDNIHEVTTATLKGREREVFATYFATKPKMG